MAGSTVDGSDVPGEAHLLDLRDGGAGKKHVPSSLAELVVLSPKLWVPNTNHSIVHQICGALPAA